MTSATPLKITDRQFDGPPLVSICCNTYNHEGYIGEAIEGFLLQETSFPVEILIHDDASTDGTAEIVRQYENRFPWLIKSLIQTENQKSKGIRVGHLNYSRAQGQYVAYCEGDDAWTDPLKLEKQISEMRRHPECHLSFHAARKINYLDSQQESIIGVYGKQKRIVPLPDVLVRTHGTIPTASCITTIDAIRETMAFVGARPYLTVGDIYMQIVSSLKGGALFIPDVMCIYRWGIEGSWTRKSRNDLATRLKHTKALIRSLSELDAITDYKYSHVIHQANRKSVKSILRKEWIDAGEKDAIYRDYGYVLKPADHLSYKAKQLFRTVLSKR